MSTETLAFKEVEHKFYFNSEDLPRFQAVCDKIPNLKEFIFATGPDKYYVKEDRFIRFRKEKYSSSGRAELTVKTKPDGAKNNIIREEFNVRVDGTPEAAVEGFIASLGFKLNFVINKNCYIYVFEDATVVMYTVVDITDGKPKYSQTFIEIEVNEELLHSIDMEEAQNILKKYETALEPLGISAYKRVKKSLFEMYSRE